MLQNKDKKRTVRDVALCCRSFFICSICASAVRSRSTAASNSELSELSLLQRSSSSDTFWVSSAMAHNEHQGNLAGGGIKPQIFPFPGSKQPPPDRVCCSTSNGPLNRLSRVHDWDWQQTDDDRAATSENVKVLLVQSLTHVRSAAATTGPLPLLSIASKHWQTVQCKWNEDLLVLQTKSWIVTIHNVYPAYSSIHQHRFKFLSINN